MAVKSSLGKILLYGLMLALILVATVMIFAIFDKTNNTSKTYGDITEHDLYEDFEFTHYDLSNSLVFNSDGNIKTFETTYGVGAEFDGTNNKYNVLVNDQPTTNNQSSYGTLLADLTLEFIDVDGTKLGEAILNLEFKFYIASTSLKITTDVGVESYGYLLEYIRVYGFDIRIIESQYHGDYGNGEEQEPEPTGEVLPWVIDSEGNVLHYLGYESDVTVPETYSYGDYMEDYVLYSYDCGIDESEWFYSGNSDALSALDCAYLLSDAYYNFFGIAKMSEGLEHTYDIDIYIEQMAEEETIVYPTLQNSGYEFHIRTGVDEEGRATTFFEITLDFFLVIAGDDYETTTLTSSALARAYQDFEIITLNIPATIESIGDYLFYENFDLTTVNFAEDSQLKSIGKGAFYNCFYLENFNTPDNVTTIEDWAFTGCSLSNFHVPSSLETIGKWAFADTKLKTFICSDSVISIGEGAFSGCGYMEDLSLGSITVLEYGVIRGLGGYDDTTVTSVKVTLPATLTIIKSKAFEGNQVPVYVYLSGNNLTAIEDNAFDSAVQAIYVESNTILTAMKLRFASYANLIALSK